MYFVAIFLRTMENFLEVTILLPSLYFGSAENWIASGLENIGKIIL
ncbi:hypothetical protein [Desulfosporosinus sp.]|nr:hypothetical protein [Desulfosporosinus sp.]MBC2724654.1 hypothetical protein [Desulfosporosinus sp.]MBC2727613.1 hypothetical protein [Desulfosporosinus sp.]